MLIYYVLNHISLNNTEFDFMGYDLNFHNQILYSLLYILYYTFHKI